MRYNAQYFYDKFKVIPDEKWVTKKFISADEKRCCALGHCGERGGLGTAEGNALGKLIPDIVQVNDGVKNYRSLGKTAKERVLKVLKYKLKGQI